MPVGGLDADVVARVEAAGCPRSELAVGEAAACRNWDLCRWLRDTGSAAGPEVVREAAASSCDEALSLVAQGFPADFTAYGGALRREDRRLVAALADAGVPFCPSYAAHYVAACSAGFLAWLEEARGMRVSRRTFAVSTRLGLSWNHPEPPGPAAQARFGRYCAPCGGAPIQKRGGAPGSP